MDDIFWVLQQAVRMLVPWDGMTRNGYGWSGIVLMLVAAVLLVVSLWGAGRGISRPRPRKARRAAFLLSAVLMLFAGMGALCMGTHTARLPRAGGPAVLGAEVLEMNGPATADLGILVTVAGLGSESPAFREPAELRQTDAAAAGRLGPILSRFRKRILVQLHGGMGWDYAPTCAVADSLDAFLRRPENRAVAAGRWNCVVAHSRGTQIAAATPLFRDRNWARFAVHPPAGVQFYLRLFSPLCQEIAEIHAVGGLMSGEKKLEALPARWQAQWLRRPDSPADFPWTAIYQARSWDHTVLRFAPAPGRPLRNVSPAGSHSTPFSVGSSRFWQEFLACLPLQQAATAMTHLQTDPPATPLPVPRAP